jgi:hypothetical protein
MVDLADPPGSLMNPGRPGDPLAGYASSSTKVGKSLVFVDTNILM